jgi:hypothetical protein
MDGSVMRRATGSRDKSEIYLDLPPLLYHYELEYPALIDSASTGMPVEKFSLF